MADERDGVNVGPDARLPWPFGMILGGFQQREAFKSSTAPIKMVTGSLEEGRLEQISYSIPNHRAFHGWAKRRPDGLWDTFRIGWRWDPFWGDEKVRGFNPQPEIVGGYFPDIILKKAQRVPHIYNDGLASDEQWAAFVKPDPEGWERVAPLIARRVGAR